MSKKYTKEHVWIETNGDVWRVGITDFAQEQLGDVVMVDLPKIGRMVASNEECAVIESVKAASDIYSPAAGEITEVNSELEDSPELVNEDPEGKGWLMDLRLTDPAELDSLMDADPYAKFVKEME